MIKYIISKYCILILLFCFIYFLYKINESKEFYNIIKKYYSIILLTIFSPFYIMAFLFLFNDKNMGDTSSWLGFLGGYFGVIGTVGTICWQVNEEKRNNKKIEKENYKSCLVYLQTIIKKNLSLLKDNKIDVSRTYHILFARKEEIIDFILLNRNVIDSNVVNFILNNHSCILELVTVLEKIEKYSFIFYEDMYIKSQCLKFFIEEGESFKEKPTEENIIFYNFLNLSNYLKEIKSGNVNWINSLGPCLYCYDSNNKSYNGFVGNSGKYNFYNYTAGKKIDKKQLNNESFEKLFEEHYEEILNILYIPPLSRTEEKKEKYFKMSETIGKLYSNDKYKMILLDEYKEALIKCDKTISEYLETFSNN